MKTNKVMKEAMMRTLMEMKGNLEYESGFNRAIHDLNTLINEGSDSSVIVPYATKKSYETFNHAEDLKDDGKSSSVIDEATGEYEAYESFLTNFKKWLVNQDNDTILIHYVNSEITIKDEVELPKLDTLGKKMSYFLTEFYLRGYEKDAEGNITHVKVGIDKGTDEDLNVFTYGEFHSLFEFGYLKEDIK